MATAETIQKTDNEIRELVTKLGYNRFNYDKEKYNFIAKYTGDNQLDGMTDTGYSFNFFTTDIIVKFMWRLAYKYGFNAKKSTKILEPSCGTGRFLRYAPTISSVTAFEPDPISHNIASVLYPKFDIINNVFESSFYFQGDNNSIQYKTTLDTYDLIIGKPTFMYPYNSSVNRYSEKELNRFPFVKSMEELFMVRATDSLSNRGLLVFLMPSWFMDSLQLESPLRDNLIMKCSMIDAYRLPSGIFDDSDITTDIIVLQKK